MNKIYGRAYFIAKFDWWNVMKVLLHGDYIVELFLWSMSHTLFYVLMTFFAVETFYYCSFV